MSKYDFHIDEEGTMVVDPRGRVGMTCNIYIRKVRIRYGADGPYATLYKKDLRIATLEEIHNAGHKGVRRGWPPE